MPAPIYLDHNATSPMLPEVADAVREASLRFAANPDSQHELGRQARRALEEARQRIAELLGAKTGGMDADRLIFTSGGTEANNLALRGLADPEQPAHFITSAIEHPCILEATDSLSERGWQVDRLQPNQAGLVGVADVATLLRENTRLATLMLANNETGVIQPVAEVVKLCAEHHVLVHTDAAQAVGKLAVNFTELGVHGLSCAPHKFGGPLGIGALVLKHGVQLRPLLRGGHQQAGLRPGTQTVALAIGTQVALESAAQHLADKTARLTELRDQFERGLKDEIPSAIVIGAASPRLPHTSCVAFPGADRQALMMALDLAGVACSTGSACASGSSEPSPTLVAMQLEKPLIDGSLRFSLGNQTTALEIADATRRIVNAHSQLQLG